VILTDTGQPCKQTAARGRVSKKKLFNGREDGGVLMQDVEIDERNVNGLARAPTRKWEGATAATSRHMETSNMAV
jgi:hypothetical protein